jgi:hypothetical protein
MAPPVTPAAFVSSMCWIADLMAILWSSCQRMFESPRGVWRPPSSGVRVPPPACRPNSPLLTPWMPRPRPRHLLDRIADHSLVHGCAGTRERISSDRASIAWVADRCRRLRMSTVARRLIPRPLAPWLDHLRPRRLSVRVTDPSLGHAWQVLTSARFERSLVHRVG